MNTDLDKFKMGNRRELIIDREWVVAESETKYENEKYPLQNETGIIIGICMEVHRILGHGFLEIVYKDAIEKELYLKFDNLKIRN